MTTPERFDQLNGILHPQGELPEGFAYDSFPAGAIGGATDQVRFARGLLSVDLRQQQSRHQPPIRVKLRALHPALAINVRYEDGFTELRGDTSFDVYATGEVGYNAGLQGHGPVTEGTRLSHLELALGRGIEQWPPADADAR
ncbi:MAG TPA: hypothetical protein VK674_03525 [Candidatus Limnocylindria bacterium]|nr:hypothetical protein [Candidatus Limnocylindria bacterium]